jgi:predicted PurR-regulated permease PerM
LSVPETKLDAPLETPEAFPASTATGAAAKLPATSLHIIATAIVLFCLYYASSIFISLISAIFIAFVLEPGVKLMQRLHIPRWMGALVMVVATLAVVYLAIYLIYDRVVAFIGDLPAYAARLRQIVSHLEVTFRSIRLSAASLVRELPGGAPAGPTVRVQAESPWAQWLLRGLGSAFGFVVSVTFMPFLVFFMLASKDQIWGTTLNLFPSGRRERAETVIRGISRMVRQYVLGNILVGLISAAIITPVFWRLGLHFALLLGPVAAFLSLIPYLGVPLGMAPPLLIALVQSDYQDIWPFLIIALTVFLVHVLAINVLTPKLVGRRVRLNALSVTIAMMLWGWMWGGIGLVLAVPITAALKAICDNIEPLKPLGEWLGES